MSNLFLDEISKHFSLIEINNIEPLEGEVLNTGMKDVKSIQKDFNISNINLIKPGVGEATRVLLRRLPWLILVDRINNPVLKPVLLLAEEKGTEVQVYSKMSYSCCGLIKPSKNKNDICI
ncbi:MAG: Cysteine protease StiP precursor [bacterium ADurb.Bin363]|nr:MAG: Cysteine protease StiP precursor [bacterium ADurb.Bin363]